MSTENSKRIVFDRTSESSLVDRDLILVGFGCTGCDWETGETEYFKAIAEYSRHVWTHIDREAHILYYYKDSGKPASSRQPKNTFK